MTTLTRRHFLSKGAMLAGGTYPAMLALGMLKAAPAHAFKLPGQVKGKKIVILGGGLAGMTCAYELGKLGYEIIVLEARQRAGGRCWSVRNGSTNVETDRPQATARFDEAQYFNAGPSRIPHNHQLTLHYCKELNVPLQVYNNVNEGAFYFAEGKGPLSNKRIRAREVHNDVRGYMAELLAKSIDHGALDESLTKEDAEKVIEYLRAEGGLDADKLYKASARRGYTVAPGAGDRPGTFSKTYKLADLLSSGLMDPDFYNVAEYTYELQMTMFQAIGGMDQIATALQKKIGPVLKFDAEVISIVNNSDNVTVRYRDAAAEYSLTADSCICTIPLPVLSNISNNFSGDVSRAVDTIGYMQTGKIGLQFKRRFWEEDDHLYGGITHTNNELTQIFYPSYDYLGKKGILIGYYNFNNKAKLTGELSYADREKLALEKGRRIHPQYDSEFESSFSVTWQKTKFSLGGWAEYNAETRRTQYPVLLKPEGRVYFAGEHLTYLNAWMAGAFESARSVVTDLHARFTEQRLHYPAASN